VAALKLAKYLNFFHDFFCVYPCSEWFIQVVLYEDELADNGISLLTAKVVCVNAILRFLMTSSWTDLCGFPVVRSELFKICHLTRFVGLLQRVMPTCWFLLLRFWVSLSFVG